MTILPSAIFPEGKSFISSGSCMKASGGPQDTDKVRVFCGGFPVML
jgi:hypothetical protein